LSRIIEVSEKAQVDCVFRMAKIKMEIRFFLSIALRVQRDEHIS